MVLARIVPIYSDLLAKIAYFSYPSLIQLPRCLCSFRFFGSSVIIRRWTYVCYCRSAISLSVERARGRSGRKECHGSMSRLKHRDRYNTYNLCVTQQLFPYGIVRFSHLLQRLYIRCVRGLLDRPVMLLL